MKKYILFLFLVQVSAISFSQVKTRLGLHFSPNMGWISPSENGAESNGALVGYSFGLTIDQMFSDNYGVATGLNVVNAGGKLKMGDLITSNTADFTMKYIGIPLALKLKTNEIGYMTYYGKFGLNTGILIKAKSESSEGTDNGFHNQIVPLRVGLLVGIGAEYNISGNTNIFTGIDFDSGFTNIFRDKSNIPKSNSSIISLTLGVFF